MEKKYYVYVYTNPVLNEVFYIGKGTGDRKYAHWDEAVSGNEKFDSAKHDYIRLLAKVGYKADAVISVVKDNLTEEEAFKLEFDMIESYGLENLTNKVSGHDYAAKAFAEAKRNNRLTYSTAPVDGCFTLIGEVENTVVALDGEYSTEFNGLMLVNIRSHFDSEKIKEAYETYGFVYGDFITHKNGDTYIFSNFECKVGKNSCSAVVWKVENDKIVSKLHALSSKNFI